MDFNRLETLQLDSKTHDCVVTLFSKEHHLQNNNITSKFSHLFGLHLIYGEGQAPESHFNSLLNKAVYFYSESTYHHFVLCPRISNRFWAYTRLDLTSQLCPFHPFANQEVYVGADLYYGMLPSEGEIIEIVMRRIFKAKMVIPVLGFNSPLYDGIILEGSKEHQVRFYCCSTYFRVYLEPN